MRELERNELSEVAGAGWIKDFYDVISDHGFADNVKTGAISLYEGAIDATSYVIGRVAGDLHPSYYE